MCACTCMHAHRSELVCTYAHSRVCSHIHTRACTYRHAHRSELRCTHVHTFMFALSCTHICMHTNAQLQVCTQMYTCTHSHTCTLLCTLPLLFMAHGSVSTPLSRPRDKRRVFQEPSTHHSRGNREDPSPSTSRHLQSALASERPLTYTGPADFIFLLHA